MQGRPHRTVTSVTRIIELVAGAHQGLTLQDLVTRMGEPRSSIYGFLGGLVHTGYLDEQDRRFFLGPAFFVIAGQTSYHGVRDIPHDEVADLADRLRASVLVGIRVGHGIMYADFAGTPATTEYLMRRQLRRPVLRAAAGQILLADMRAAELDAFLSEEQDHDAITGFLEIAQQIRESGYVAHESELVAGSWVIATALRDARGQAVATLSAVCAAGDYADRRDEITAEVMSTARRWSRYTASPAAIPDAARL